MVNLPSKQHHTIFLVSEFLPCTEKLKEKDRFVGKLSIRYSSRKYFLDTRSTGKCRTPSRNNVTFCVLQRTAFLAISVHNLVGLKQKRGIKCQKEVTQKCYFSTKIVTEVTFLQKRHSRYRNVNIDHRVRLSLALDVVGLLNLGVPAVLTDF